MQTVLLYAEPDATVQPQSPRLLGLQGLMHLFDGASSFGQRCVPTSAQRRCCVCRAKPKGIYKACAVCCCVALPNLVHHVKSTLKFIVLLPPVAYRA